MKIFLDTNIFLDLILKRDGYQEAVLILNSCNQSIFKGYIADITLINIDYIASKQHNEVKSFLEAINDSFIVVGFDNAMFKMALKINNRDLEDNTQYICAKKHDCKLIVSNDKKFYKGDIRVITSKKFIGEYL